MNNSYHSLKYECVKLSRKASTLSTINITGITKQFEYISRCVSTDGIFIYFPLRLSLWQLIILSKHWNIFVYQTHVDKNKAHFFQRGFFVALRHKFIARPLQNQNQWKRKKYSTKDQHAILILGDRTKYGISKEINVYY